MSILVVGSVALESVETPFGISDHVLGGSATYFSVSASFFSDVKLIGVVGDDFPEEHIEFLKSRRIDLAGLARVPGKTFFWKARYGIQLRDAETLETQLNVHEFFIPKIDQTNDVEYVMLANTDPDVQIAVLDQIKKPKIVVCDSMNYWISSKVDSLKKVLNRVDFFIINEAEARQLSGEYNLIKAAKSIVRMGVKRLIIKRGEFGVLMFDSHSVFGVPAYPLDEVIDPTGAGDTFAGGFLGFLANRGIFSEEDIRRGIVIGCVLASFAVQAFSIDRLRPLSSAEIYTRYLKLRDMTHFDDLGDQSLSPEVSPLY